MNTSELLQKQEFVNHLGQLYAEADIDGVREMCYFYNEPLYDDFEYRLTHYDESVAIIYKNDRKKIANISCDSCQAIMLDVYKRLFGGDR